MSPPNVLLVVLDSVRAKNCSLYGHENTTTPYLSKFAESATTFTQARSPSIHSAPSHASIFSGYHTEEHGITEHESYLRPEASIWNELATDYDYETGIFSPNVIINKSTNLYEPFGTRVGPKPKPDPRSRLFEDALSPIDNERNHGFIDYAIQSISSDSRIKALANGIAAKLSPEVDYTGIEAAGVYVDHLLEWVLNQNENWAACLNLMDAHYPYCPKDEYNHWGGQILNDLQRAIPDGPLSFSFPYNRPMGELRALESLYDGGIRQLDSELNRLVSALDQMGELSETLLVITSDHGEGFGERSRLTPQVRLVDHSWGISECLTHVPLLIKEPGQKSGKYVSKAVSLTKFPDAVRAAIGGDASAEAFTSNEGPVLSSTCRVQPPGDRVPLPPDKIKSYFGPWRAVYDTDSNGTVVKHAARRDDCITMKIPTAQSAYPIETEQDQGVNDLFNSLTDAMVKIGNAADRETAKDTEQRLSDLGYL